MGKLINGLMFYVFLGMFIGGIALIPLEVELSQNHSVNVSCEEYDGDICQYDIDTKTNVDETVRVYEVVLSQLEEKEVLAVEF